MTLRRVSLRIGDEVLGWSVLLLALGAAAIPLIVSIKVLGALT